MANDAAREMCADCGHTEQAHLALADKSDVHCFGDSGCVCKGYEATARAADAGESVPEDVRYVIAYLREGRRDEPSHLRRFEGHAIVEYLEKLQSSNAALLKRAEEAERRVLVLLECAEHYADRKTWMTAAESYGDDQRELFDVYEPDCHGYDKARQAIAEAKEVGDGKA